MAVENLLLWGFLGKYFVMGVSILHEKVWEQPLVYTIQLRGVQSVVSLTRKVFDEFCCIPNGDTWVMFDGNDA